MKASEIDQRVEALLFASGDPISIEKLSICGDLKVAEVERSLERLIEKYQEAGLSIIEVGKDHYQLCTNPNQIEYVNRLLTDKKDTPLSSAALEVLAVIVYNEPVTRSFVEQVRGVDSSGVINSLLQKGLLEEYGRLNLPGKPIAYQTTNQFLRCFSLTDREELPQISELVEQFEAAPFASTLLEGE